VFGLVGHLGFGCGGELDQADADGLLGWITEFIQINALDLGAIEQGTMEVGVGGFEAATGEEDHPLPVVVESGVAVEVEAGFGKEAIVEGFIALKLHFREKYSLGGGGGWGQENAINAEGGFFDFDRLKPIVAGLLGGLVNQGKEQAGKAFEDLVKNRVAAHGGSLGKWARLIVR
jgi:hypothetical protein